MHFNRKELISAVTAATKVIGKSRMQPILCCVKIEFTEVGAQLTATDLDTWYIRHLPAGVATGTYGPVCLVAKQLLEVLKTRKDDLVLITGIGETVTVDGLKVESFSTEDYPQAPVVEFKSGEHVVMNAEHLQRVADQVAWAAADYDYSHSVLGAIYFKGIEVAATDGSRLSQIDLTGMVGTMSATLMPANVFTKVVAPLLKQAAKETSTIKMAAVTMFGSPTVVIKCGDWLVVTRTVPGEYPRYQELFSENTGSFVTYKKTDILAVLKQLKPYLDKRTNVVAFDPEAGHVSVGDQALSLTAGISPKLHATLTTDVIRWICNFNYLVQAIESVPGEYVDIQYSSPRKPLVFFATDYRHLLMPVETKVDRERYEADVKAKKAIIEAAAV